ncbi:hypothetical protein [Flammeovirga sp. OC4]|uniref:hypothetical protein n=1 Tax=Flammeovirga sp. OC4 TaxID=1382345 RepID=UPI0005C601BC|nr:hypothetical protein [Flammeovirga sp. OC4]
MKYQSILHLLLYFCTLCSTAFAQVSDPVQETADVFFPEKVVLALNHPYYNFSINDAYLKGMKYESTLGETEVKKYYRTTVPQVSMMGNPMENSDSYEYEMRSAKLMGIDGFKFEFRPLGTDYYIKQFKKIFSAYVKVAEDKNIDFKFSIAVEMDRTQNIPVSYLLMKVENTLNELFKSTNYSKKWLRTGNNKVIVFTKFTQKVIDEGLEKKYTKQFLEDPSLMKKVADVYTSLKKGLHDDVAFVYQGDFIGNNRFMHQVLDHFPAIYTLRGIQSYEVGMDRLAEVCKKRNRPFIQSVYSDLQGANRHSVKTNRIIQNTNISDKETFVKAHNYKMTSDLRKLLEKGLKRDANMMFVSSWNYYDNGSHFAPELHHGYGLGLILKYYKNKWLDGNFESHEDMVFTSFKNYLPGELNQNNGVQIRFRNKEKYQLQDLDSVEVVTVLKEGGDVYFNEKYLGFAPKGIHTFYVEKEKGKMQVKVKREKNTVVDYTVPKQIIGKQDKTDFITYTFSNLDRSYAQLNQNIILDNEMHRMRNRFLISKDDEIKWRLAASKRFLDNLQAMYDYGSSSSKCLDMQEKNYKKYKQQIKEILPEFNYGIWLELEESAMNNEGIPIVEDNLNEALKGYNILPEYTKQK